MNRFGTYPKSTIDFYFDQNDPHVLPSYIVYLISLFQKLSDHILWALLNQSSIINFYSDRDNRYMILM